MTGLLRIGKVLQVNLQDKQTIQIDKHTLQSSQSSPAATPEKIMTLQK